MISNTIFFIKPPLLCFTLNIFLYKKRHNNTKFNIIMFIIFYILNLNGLILPSPKNIYYKLLQEDDL